MGLSKRSLAKVIPLLLDYLAAPNEQEVTVIHDQLAKLTNFDDNVLQCLDTYKKNSAPVVHELRGLKQDMVPLLRILDVIDEEFGLSELPAEKRYGNRLKAAIRLLPIVKARVNNIRTQSEKLLIDLDSICEETSKQLSDVGIDLKAYFENEKKCPRNYQTTLKTYKL